MTNTITLNRYSISHKNYIGYYTWNNEANAFVDSIMLRGNDPCTFCGNCLTELNNNFKRVVDEYLDYLADMNEVREVGELYDCY